MSDLFLEKKTTKKNLPIFSDPSGEPMRIGNENVFEVQCVVRAKSIGNNNSIQVQADLKQGAQIGKNLYKLKKKKKKPVVLQKSQ